MMAGRVRRSIALALAGLLGGLGLVLALFDGGDVLRRVAPRGETAAPPAGAGPGSGSEPTAGPGATAEADTSPIAEPGARAETKPGAAPAAGDARSDAAGAKPAPGPAAPEAPRFDIVRVEPNGEAVVAGRGAPNTVVEMLVDGKPVAKALADPTGQFAIVPPALPTGASEIQLRTRDADGREARSRQSVAVDVAPGRDRKPLVALTAPDRATVVLSQPGVPGAVAAGTGTAAGKPAAGAAGAGGAEPTRIVSVDAQDGGRLYVTAAGTPGESVRLYLNDTLIAPGSVGPDGRVTFTIGRGIAPGQYRVRVDRVEPGTGKVRDRAEVPFAVPEPTRLAARDAPPARAGGAGEARAVAPEPKGSGQGGTGQGETARAEAPAGPKASGSAAAPLGMAGTRMAGSPAAGSAAARDVAARDAAAGAPAPGTAGVVFVPEVGTARIIRGDNLWRISQRAYGRGERYTVIYGANQDQIRNPDLIYPGQTFVLPADKRG